MNPWLLGGGALAVLLLAGTRKAAAAPMPTPYTSPRSRDLDALANMLITETSFRKSRQEMAAIVFIAINRAKRQGKPLWFVVQPGEGPKPVWNKGPVYRQRFENARNNNLWGSARAFAASVLNGTSGFRNTGATSFVHPGHPNFNMPCKDNKQVQMGWWKPAWVSGYGTRCIPTWAAKGNVIGSGLFA
jgi:hypothetical protein